MAQPDVATPVLVTGGAGYIGSHVVLALIEAGYRAVVMDDLSTGEKRVVPPDIPLEIGDVGDRDRVSAVLQRYGCDSVMHFAGSIIVSESMREPLKYYANNTVASRNLIECCVANGVSDFVFSSSAAVYGAPETLPIAESSRLDPISPYGASKLMTERMLNDVAAVSDLRVALLRYFNVAGADPKGRAGQVGPNSTHLIKIAAELIAGHREKIEIFGVDYDTPDGTCVRDFTHVSDLATAHVLALQYLRKERRNVTLNCGYGHGFSVREILAAVSRVSRQTLNVDEAPRRVGDAPQLISETSKIREVLNWRPRYDDIDIIIQSSIDWERAKAG